MQGGCYSSNWPFIGLANQGKDIVVLRFIIEYSSSLWDFGPLGNNNNNNNNRSIFIIWGFLKDDDILACVETWDISYYIIIIISWRILVSISVFFLQDYVYFCMVKYFWISIILLLPFKITFQCKWQGPQSDTTPPPPLFFFLIIATKPGQGLYNKKSFCFS